MFQNVLMQISGKTIKFGTIYYIRDKACHLCCLLGFATSPEGILYLEVVKSYRRGWWSACKCCVPQTSLCSTAIEKPLCFCSPAHLVPGKPCSSCFLRSTWHASQFKIRVYHGPYHQPWSKAPHSLYCQRSFALLASAWAQIQACSSG